MMESRERADALDPVTIEIVSHRLHEITREIAMTLERVGSTVNTTQMKDYIATLYWADGSLLSPGPVASWHTYCAGKAVRAIIDRYAKDVSPGDMFLLNDPYVAAIHQSDLYIIAPIHVDGSLVMWSATFVHVMDIGALSPGGNSPGSTEIEHEGLRIGPMRIVQGGQLRTEILDVFTSMTRQPEMVGLDIRCQMAANFVARDRVVDLYRRYGKGFLDSLFRHSISSAQSVVERRLDELPDCELYEDLSLPIAPDESVLIACTLRKSGSVVEFDFSSSSDASSMGVNLPVQATFGACAEAVFNTLAADIQKNEGVFASIRLKTRPNSVVSASYPAPVSLNTTSGGAAAKFVARSLMSRLVATSPRWSGRTAAPGLVGRVARHAGVSQHDDFYVSTLHSLRGGGAGLSRDGADCGGPHSTHNVEWLEGNFPLLQLYRRYRTNGGGPGKYRGGAGEESTYRLHKAPEQNIRLVAFGTVGALNSGHGIFGGYPGAASEFLLYAGQSASWPPGADAGSAAGDTAPRRLWYEDVVISGDDVLVMSSACGGGIGDPLLREPSRILTDLRKGLIDAGGAQRDYGVVVREGQLDIDATRSARLATREQRRLAATADGHDWPVPDGISECDPDAGRCDLAERAADLQLASLELPIVWAPAGDPSLRRETEGPPWVRLVCCPKCWSVIDSRSSVEAPPDSHVMRG